MSDIFDKQGDDEKLRNGKIKKVNDQPLLRVLRATIEYLRGRAEK